jgi:hypothetical protein
VATEHFLRKGVQLTGTVRRGRAGDERDRVQYRGTLVDDGSAPLIEVAAWRGEDPEDARARQTARVIFKDDSVAIDQANSTGGVVTTLFATRRAAIPFLNLSMAWLEQATRRFAASHADSLVVPFFNLGGGQTVTGTLRRLGRDSTAVLIGSVEFRLRVDATGRILGGAVPAQELLIFRTPAR